MPQNFSSAPRRRRRTPRPHPAAIAVALGLVTFTGLASTSAAVAATQPSSSELLASVVAIGPEETLQNISEDAHSTLNHARAAVSSSQPISAEIAASGLDVGVADTTVDTTALRAQIDQLSQFEVTPALLLPGVTEQTAAETKRVLAEAAQLRDRLDAAKAEKAKEEAAAKAAARAAAKAKAEKEAAAVARAAANTPAGAQATARKIASSRYGWGADQFSCLSSLWNKESSWNYQANNPSSGAYGIAQALPGSKMATTGSDWQTNASTQVAWGLSYIDRAYGTPCAAWGHSQSVNWY